MSPQQRDVVAPSALDSPNGATIANTCSAEDPDWGRCLAAGGEMGARILSFDWSRTPLGPLADWPASLRNAVNLCLRSRFQLAIYWGPQLNLLYNDAERDVLGAMHPAALGKPAVRVLAEIWDVVGPKLQSVMATGEATWSVDEPLRLNRRGFTEESFFTYSYSPIPEGDGIGGVLLVTFETTERVLAERRLRTLRELAAESANAQSADEACIRSAAALAANPSDIPFCLLFLTDGDGTMRLGASTGVAGDPDPNDWPLREAIATQQARRVHDVSSRLNAQESPAPRVALVLPFARAKNDSVAGCLVVGVSELRALDEPYRGFLDLVAGQIATAIARAGVLTARKRSEEDLLQARDELERRVRERTRELSRANARLARQISKRRQVEEARTGLLRRLERAREEEHRRIARELHDDLTQRLAILAIDAGTIEQLAGCPQAIGDRARGIRNQLVALSESVHSLSRQLHPSILDDLGLVDALRSECLRLYQRDGIRVEFAACNVPAAVPRSTALCVYRVAQEALRNVAHHARATRATVQLLANEGELMLCVRDRGVGFDVAAGGRTGLGLESMRERSRLIGARLAVHSRPGKGTSVTIRVPLEGIQP